MVTYLRELTATHVTLRFKGWQCGSERERVNLPTSSRKG